MRSVRYLEATKISHSFVSDLTLGLDFYRMKGAVVCAWSLDRTSHR
jgi:hypothetical protein